MERTNRCACFWGIAALLSALTFKHAFAAVWGEGEPVQFEILGLSDGLSDSTIFSVAQGDDGRLWFGSASGGVNVYDGYEVTSFMRGKSEESLSHSDAGEVFVDSRGDVYIGTWGGGLNRLIGPGRFERLNPGTEPSRVQVIFEDSRGRLWIGSGVDGLFEFDRQSKSFRRLNGDRVPERIWSLAEDAQGVLWIAASNGLFSLSDNGVQHVEYSWAPHPRALTIADQRLWVADNETVYQVGQTIEPVARSLPLINTLSARQESGVLVGTLSGLWALDSEGGQVSPFGNPSNVLFPERNIRRIFTDRAGVTWIATREAGLIKAVPVETAFDGFVLPSRLDTVDTLVELNAETLLLGSRRGLTLLTGDDDVRLQSVPGTEDFAINRFLRSGDDVLVGTGTGVFRFEPETNAMAPATEFEAVSDLMITVLDVSPSGDVLVGTWQDGLYQFRDGAVVSHWPEGNDGLPDASVSDVAFADDGSVIVGLWNEGVVRIDASGEVDHMPALNEVVTGHVHDLQLADETLWIASSFGLVRWMDEPSQAVNVPLISGQATVAAQRIAAAGERIWVATTRGLIAVDTSSLNAITFGVADGLAVQEFFSRSGSVGASGRVYFGGLGGFVSFRPEEVLTPGRMPQVSVTHVWVDNVPVSVDSVVMPPGSDALRVRALAADFRSPDRNRFRVQLDGLEKQWRTPDGNPEVTYSGLAPGQYQLHIEGANSNGVWSEEPAILDIRVLPFWWQTAWGRAGILLAILTAVYFWHAVRTRAIRARNRELEQEVARQTKALKKANRHLADAASTDYLTTLLNRRGFLARLETVDASQPWHFALIDVDDFKTFNDEYGHDVGDSVLCEVADALLSAIPDSLGYVGRWGGEEFIAVLAGQNRDTAVAAAEHARQTVADWDFSESVARGRVTVTIGVSTLQPEETWSSAISRADRRLIAGKQEGKNRVISVTTGSP